MTIGKFNGVAKNTTEVVAFTWIGKVMTNELKALEYTGCVILQKKAGSKWTPRRESERIVNNTGAEGGHRQHEVPVHYEISLFSIQ